MDTTIQKFQIEKFFKYLNIPSQSSAASGKLPSSEGQMELANVLASELKELGLKSTLVNQNSIVTALLPATSKNMKSVGFVAHLDTVDVGLSPNISPQIIKYEGTDIVLNKEKNIIFKISENPDILNYLNEDIIFSDGTSVLGADNKAAIATLITTLKYIVDNSIEHGDIHISFVPDEEIGLLGAKELDLNIFNPDFAYTIDACGIGEIVYETFNAASAIINIEGITAHPMSAKGVLVNPILIAVDIISNFDRLQTPEYTDGREGYIWTQGISGNQLTSHIKLNIRDHDKKLFKLRKDTIRDAVQKTIVDNPRAKITLEINDVYSNISDSIKDDKFPIDVLYKALEHLNIKPITKSMRGGTDGSALSARGLLTPNYFTGAYNFHSVNEFLPLSSFYKSFEFTLEIIKIIAKITETHNS